MQHCAVPRCGVQLAAQHAEEEETRTFTEAMTVSRDDRTAIHQCLHTLGKPLARLLFAFTKHCTLLRPCGKPTQQQCHVQLVACRAVSLQGLLTHVLSCVCRAVLCCVLPQALASQLKAAKAVTRGKQAAAKKLEQRLQQVQAEMKATMEVRLAAYSSCFCTGGYVGLYAPHVLSLQHCVVVEAGSRSEPASLQV